MATTVIDVPHTLGREEAKRRMRARIGDLAGRIPGGAATVEAGWPGEDRMAVTVTTMGQTVHAVLDVEDRLVRVGLDLPHLLSFMAAPIAAIVKRSGQEMLEDHAR